MMRRSAIAAAAALLIGGAAGLYVLSLGRVADGAPLQSQLTHLVLAEMIERGTSVLPAFAESADLHVKMLRVFLGHLGFDKPDQTCAIT